MRLAFIVDPPASLDPAGDSSIALMEAAQSRGHEIWIAETRHLLLNGNGAALLAQHIELIPGTREGGRWIPGDPWFRPANQSHSQNDLGTRIAFDDIDAVFFRTDPPVNGPYLWATYLLDFVDHARTVLINDPAGVRSANEKLYALRFPDLVPPTLVTADYQTIFAFVRDHRRAVIKPIDGHAGRGVLQLCVEDPNVPSMVETVTGRGAYPAVVQPYLDDAAAGNKRILLFDGEVIGAVNRLIEPGDFRTGAPVAAATLTDRDREIVARVTPALRRDGLLLAGLDAIGDFLIEVNVTSPGGLRHSDLFQETRGAERVIARLEEGLTDRK